MKHYNTYILLCSDQTLYTGYTTDLNRRLREHNKTNKGAKYTRSRRPVKLLMAWTFKSRSEALKFEYKIKKLSRKEKLKLISDEEDKRGISRKFEVGDLIVYKTKLFRLNRGNTSLAIIINIVQRDDEVYFVSYCPAFKVNVFNFSWTAACNKARSNSNYEIRINKT
jgi:putative endonuclease